MKKIRETASLVLGAIAFMALVIGLFLLGANDLTVEGYKLVITCIITSAAFGYGSWRIAWIKAR